METLFFCLHEVVMRAETGWGLLFLSSGSCYEDGNWVRALIFVFMELS